MYYLQRVTVVPALRQAAARSIAAGIRIAHGRGEVSAQSHEVCRRLRDDGMALLPNLLSPDEVDCLVKRLEGYPVCGPKDQLVALEKLPAGTGMAPYPLATILDNEQIVRTANDASILGIAADYLHCVPTISSIGLRWSFPTPRRRDSTQYFHRDGDDWRFLKVFVYLTDVDATSGPHIYVRGSHRTAARLRARPYSSSEVERRFGPDNIVRITGPRGTTFIADTYGIHRGEIPLEKPRLIFQVQYSLLPIYAFLYDPKPVPIERLHRHVNRLLIAT
jgi:hypothetical protein